MGSIESIAGLVLAIRDRYEGCPRSRPNHCAPSHCCNTPLYAGPVLSSPLTPPPVVTSTAARLLWPTPALV